LRRGRRDRHGPARRRAVSRRGVAHRRIVVADGGTRGG
jgi:hypothetical protein